MWAGFIDDELFETYEYGQIPLDTLPEKFPMFIGRVSSMNNPVTHSEIKSFFY
jgi:hypothetical protein